MDCVRLKTRCNSDFMAQAHYGSLWYAAHTYPNHDKRVAEQFTARSAKQFLPIGSCCSSELVRNIRLFSARQKPQRQIIYPARAPNGRLRMTRC